MCYDSTLEDPTREPVTVIEVEHMVELISRSMTAVETEAPALSQVGHESPPVSGSRGSPASLASMLKIDRIEAAQGIGNAFRLARNAPRQETEKPRSVACAAPMGPFRRISIGHPMRTESPPAKSARQDMREVFFEKTTKLANTKYTPCMAKASASQTK